jgi:hypothetical protein
MWFEHKLYVYELLSKIKGKLKTLLVLKIVTFQIVLLYTVERQI